MGSWEEVEDPRTSTERLRTIAGSSFYGAQRLAMERIIRSSDRSGPERDRALATVIYASGYMEKTNIRNEAAWELLASDTATADDLLAIVRKCVGYLRSTAALQIARSELTDEQRRTMELYEPRLMGVSDTEHNRHLRVVVKILSP